ncbi:MAG: ABC transporter ATP-binding protein [Firmicutes bacterium]|nr:ABC transporter ATP-binding protein [Bacillota bacterium]
MTFPAIRAEDLTKRFGDLVAVDGVTFEVLPGELFGFLGPNGAGKTTTIKMMVGLLRPTAGKVAVAGFDLAADPVSAKARLGYVPDEPALYDKLTGREFLRLVAAVYRMDWKTVQGRVVELLELFDLSAQADDLLGGWSHGMRQKVALAAALLHEPEVLVLDEPTVGLDPRAARLVKDILREFCRRGGTVFMSTHILEIAEAMCDRVGIIDRGRLVAVGTEAELRGRVGAGDSDALTLEDVFLRVTGGPESADARRAFWGEDR